MKSISFCLFLCVFCSCNNSKELANQKPFPALEYQKDEWAFYEGRWKAKEGIIKLELSLKTGSFGIDSDYSFYQYVLNDESAQGAGGRGKYSTNNFLKQNELGICLHDLHPAQFGFLRYPASDGKMEEMFFITRGNDELIPCDNDYKPLTTDWRYTLHRRSNLFTVEGYVTFYTDSVEFYERNVMQKWGLADLEEFQGLKLKYRETAKEPFEGIYLKALAYSIADTIPNSEKRLLVIKWIKDFNNDPD